MLGQAERQREEQRKEEEEKRKQLWNEILAALFTSHYEDHKGRNQDRVEGTCEWSTGHSLFSHWKETRLSSLLWISADPGFGKSVLAKYLVDHVVPTTNRRTTCYFFFKADSSDQGSAANAMCALLRQLLLQRPGLRERHPWILDKFGTDKDQLTTSFSSLWDMLVKVSMSQEEGEVICVLNALDECAESDRQQLTRALDKLYRSKDHKGTLKFLVTSRLYAHIQREFQLLKNAVPTIHLSGEDDVEANNIEQEINLVIQRKVEEIGDRLELEEHERSFLKQELLQISNRTYLWVTLIIDMMENTLSYTNKRLQEMIEILPKAVDEAYERILSQSPDMEKARRLLHMVVGAIQPLTVKEMRVALAVDPAHSEYNSLDLESEARFAKTAINLCGLFVTIVDGKIFLLHQTAKEFLVSTSMPQESRIPDNETISRADHNVGGNDEDANIRLCRWKHPLHPAEYGNIGIVRLLISQEKSIDINKSTFDNRRTALWHAIEKGLEDMVELLLDNGANAMDLKLFGGLTPVAYAAKNGYTGILAKLLMRNGASLMFGAEKEKSIPLLMAAQHGREGVVELLLQTPAAVDLDARDKMSGITPLLWASAHGHEGVVKHLLEAGARDSECAGSFGRSGLSVFCESGNTTLVKVLLETGRADPNLRSIEGRTPLSYACEKGHGVIVDLLLGTGRADVNSQSSYGQTPLSYACEEGHVDVVRQLLAIEPVDPHLAVSGYGRTPLSWAASRGHKEIAQLLLDTKAVGLGSRNFAYNRTPAMWAAANNYDKLARLLQHTDPAGDNEVPPC
ncbi:ankyrin repeat-containing domain protein [Aspergillus germanicus]